MCLRSFYNVSRRHVEGIWNIARMHMEDCRMLPEYMPLERIQNVCMQMAFRMLLERLQTTSIKAQRNFLAGFWNVSGMFRDNLWKLIECVQKLLEYIWRVARMHMYGCQAFSNNSHHAYAMHRDCNLNESRTPPECIHNESRTHRECIWKVSENVQNVCRLFV